MGEMEVPGFPKNPTTRVVGLVNTYNGRRLAHIREMIAAVNETGWIHGPGVAVPVERASELADAVAKLQDVAALEATVAKITLGKDEIRIGTQTYQGHNLVYVRKFFQQGDKWLPTKQGVSVRVTLVDELVELARRLAEAASGESRLGAERGGDLSSPPGSPPSGDGVKGGGPGDPGERCSHEMLPGQCSQCEAKASAFPEWVYMTMGGSRRYHRRPDCEAMLEGQEMVHDRGGETAEVREVSRVTAESAGKTPCRSCFSRP